MSRNSDLSRGSKNRSKHVIGFDQGSGCEISAIEGKNTTTFNENSVLMKTYDENGTSTERITLNNIRTNHDGTEAAIVVIASEGHQCGFGSFQGSVGGDSSRFHPV